MKLEREIENVRLENTQPTQEENHETPADCIASILAEIQTQQVKLYEMYGAIHTYCQEVRGSLSGYLDRLDAFTTTIDNRSILHTIDEVTTKFKAQQDQTTMNQEIHAVKMNKQNFERAVNGVQTLLEQPSLSSDNQTSFNATITALRSKIDNLNALEKELSSQARDRQRTAEAFKVMKKKTETKAESLADNVGVFRRMLQQLLESIEDAMEYFEQGLERTRMED